MIGPGTIKYGRNTVQGFRRPGVEFFLLGLLNRGYCVNYKTLCALVTLYFKWK